MRFRVVTLNLEQDHKRWPARRPLIEAELARLGAGHRGAERGQRAAADRAASLRTALSTAAGVDYGLVQQTKVNSLSKVEAEAMLSRFPVIESGNLDYQAGDMVALVAQDPLARRVAPRRVRDPSLPVPRRRIAAPVPGAAAGSEWIDNAGPGRAPRASSAAISTPASTSRRPGPDGDALSPDADRTDRLHRPRGPWDGSVSHPYWPRLDRCIDYIWVSPDIEVLASGVCFDQPSATDATLWPSDHAGVWADLRI